VVFDVCVRVEDRGVARFLMLDTLSACMEYDGRKSFTLVLGQEVKTWSRPCTGFVGLDVYSDACNTNVSTCIPAASLCHRTCTTAVFPPCSRRLMLLRLLLDLLLPPAL